MGTAPLHVGFLFEDLSLASAEALVVDESVDGRRHLPFSHTHFAQIERSYFLCAHKAIQECFLNYLVVSPKMCPFFPEKLLVSPKM